jgi:hypothetical protein
MEVAVDQTLITKIIISDWRPSIRFPTERLLIFLQTDGTFENGEVRFGHKPRLGGPHVRFRRVQTLVREGSPLVKLRNSA